MVLYGGISCDLGPETCWLKVMGLLLPPRKMTGLIGYGRWTSEPRSGRDLLLVRMVRVGYALCVLSGSLLDVRVLAGLGLYSLLLKLNLS